MGPGFQHREAFVSAIRLRLLTPTPFSDSLQMAAASNERLFAASMSDA